MKGQFLNNGIPTGTDIVDDNPVGFVRFDSDGKGEQNYSFTLLGTVYPNTGTFLWTATSSEIRIRQFAQPDLIWIRKINQPDLQQATYRIPVILTTSIDYTLTLRK